MFDPFARPKASLAAGGRYAKSFAEASDAFLDSPGLFCYAEEQDQQTGETVGKVKMTKPFPFEIEELARESLAATRNALDQTLSVFRSGAKSFFPWGKTKSDYENQIKGKCSDLPTPIVDIVRNCMAFKDGAGFLWAMNELNNIDKHTSIVRVLGMYVPETKASLMLSGGQSSLMMPRWNSSENEMEIWRGTSKIFIQNYQVSAVIVLTGVDIVEGRDAAEFLKTCNTQVGYRVGAFEFEASRSNLL